MVTNLPPAYDITGVIDRLKSHRRTKQAAFALEHYLDVASAHTDLLYARELLVTIVMDAQGGIEHPSPYRPAVLGTLLAHVILLYARAAIVKNARHRFDIRKHLSAEQLDLHKRIDGWRDQAVAHFDRSARHEEALWADERLIFTPTQPLQLRHATKRLVIRNALVQQLISQVELVLGIFQELMREKHALAEQSLSNLRQDATVRSWLEDHSFDAASFFENFERAADFLGAGSFAGVLHSSR